MTKNIQKSKIPLGITKGVAMVLINIDSLSLNELAYIAQIEDIQGYEDMSREELIDELKELYEEEDDVQQLPGGDNVNIRFVAGLTDYRGDATDVDALPGVEALPELYSETSINLLTKNASWLYCYWSISPLDQEKFAERYPDHTLLLNVVIKEEGKKEYNYDIPISEEDHEWNISVPHHIGTCLVELMLQDTEGNRFVICSSQEVELMYCYWVEHAEEARSNEDLIKRYLSLLTNKYGHITYCSTVQEVVDMIKQEEVLV